MTEPIRGLFAAPYTAMKPSGDLDLDKVPAMVELLAGYGVKGVFVGGTTGEGLSLTTQERIDLATRWVAEAGDALRVLVHVGHASFRDTREMMLKLCDKGVSGFGTLPPTFFKPTTIEDLALYCEQVAATAPDVPFYYYHIPSMSGVDLDMRPFMERIAPSTPNFAGIKFTYENLMDYSDCLQFEAGRYDILFGRDEMLLAGLSLGTRGAIGSTYNYAAPLYLELWDAFQRGDLERARECQARSRALIDTLRSHGGVLVAGKSLMKMIGVDCGPCRLPLRQLSPEREEALRKSLEDIEFFEWSGNARSQG